jgi:hypothetical protein
VAWFGRYQQLRDRLKWVSSGSSLILSWMASGLLILRRDQDADNNESRQNAGGTVAAERQAAMINWLVEFLITKLLNASATPMR